MGVVPHLLSCLRQGFLLLATVYTRLAGWLISKILLPVAYVPVGVLALWKLSAMHLVWTWVLEIRTQALTVAQQALLPNELSHHPQPNF